MLRGEPKLVVVSLKLVEYSWDPPAQIALKYGPPEYLALGVFGLTTVASLDPTRRPTMWRSTLGG
jgi:TctA family transporter